MKFFEDYSWPMKNSDHKPFLHQKETTKFLLYNKRAYVLSDIGTGKTLCPLWATDILFNAEKIRTALIVSPLSTIRVVWAYEIFNNFPHRKFAIAHGTRDQRIQALRSKAHYIIINHDGIKSCHDEINRLNPDIIVIDELTAFKNYKSDRTKVMYDIALKAKAVWGMTGSPTPNSPSEAFGQAKVVNPNNMFLPRYYTKFRSMVETEIGPYMWIPKPDAKNIVHKVLQPSIRYERDQCLDLPPVLHQIIETKMSPEQLKAYIAIRDQFYHEMDTGQISAVNAAVKLSKLLQISAGSVKTDDGHILHLNIDHKIEQIIQTFEELGKTKLIVVSAFRASVERLHAILSKETSCEYIHGGVASNPRSDIISRFQHGDLSMLVLQPQAMAHGINLTASSTILWQSMVASGEVHNQMNGRITRAGQDKKQLIKYLICSKAEGHIYKILMDKVDISDAILDMFTSRSL